jgi:hypothetical protein
VVLRAYTEEFVMKRLLLVFAIAGIAALMCVEATRGAVPRFRPFPGGGFKPQQRPGAGAGQGVDYEFSVLETAKVRLLNPPAEFDDKGNPRKLTSEELKKRKGDDPAEQKLTGVKSDFGVLKPGDVVQITFSRPKNPKDLENTTWTTLSGQMVGVVADVNPGKTSKSLTVRVFPNGPPTAGDGGNRKGMLRGDAPKNVIKPDQRQASIIVIAEQGPDQDARPGKKGKNK